MFSLVGGLRGIASVLSTLIVPHLYSYRKPDGTVLGASAKMDLKAMDIWLVPVAAKFLQCATQKSTCLANVEEQLEWLC